MADYLTTDTELTSIANAIRTKGGTSAALAYPTEFISAINAITTAGTYQSKTASPSEAQVVVTPDSGYDALSQVTVTAVSSNYVGSNIARHSSADLTFSGGTFSVPKGYYENNASKNIAVGGGAPQPAVSLNSSTGVVTATVTVASAWYSSGSSSKTLSLTTQAAATITPTESEQTAVASGKYSLGAVKVAAISSNFIGSNIATRSAADLSASGSVVTVPSGYYAAAASKAVSAGSAATPATTITVTPGITVSTAGLITATVNSSKSITPTVSAGYVSSGTAGTVTASGSNTSQLSVQAAQTITPTTTNQTIPSGKYLTGVQTVKGDANLVAANIANGVTIFGITGTHQGGVTIDDIIIIGDYGACFSNFSINQNTCVSAVGTISGNTLIAI